MSRAMMIMMRRMRRIHLYRRQIMYRMVLNGEVNHRNEVAGRLREREMKSSQTRGRCSTKIATIHLEKKHVFPDTISDKASRLRLMTKNSCLPSQSTQFRFSSEFPTRRHTWQYVLFSRRWAAQGPCYTFWCPLVKWFPVRPLRTQSAIKSAIGTYFGSSRIGCWFGSSRPCPAGFAAASYPASNSMVISTLPCGHNIHDWIKVVLWCVTSRMFSISHTGTSLQLL